MGARVRARHRQRPRGAGVSYSRESLERLARILVRSGHSPKQLTREFREICGGLKEPARRWNPAQLAYFFDLPHVIAHWHADPQYIDSRGVPIPLPLRGRGPSLSALIERALPGESPTAVANSLVRLQGVRRRGNLYVVRGRYFSYRSASGTVHGLTALMGMLRTVERNLATGRKTIPILERTALNPGFPISELPAFHRRLKAKAAEFLWSVDGDMRRREAAHGKGPTARLGVGVFAFEEPRRDGASRKRRPRRRKSR
jgi:hypothetical protein